MIITLRHVLAGSALVVASSLPAISLAQSPSAQQALKLNPIQKGVDYDQPTPAELDECTIKAEKSGKGTGWVVRDPSGQILRQFADTNGDNVVDRWSYFRSGLEVYRDQDSDFNGKADQSRWLGPAGTRWGIDKNEDGELESWKAISPEEVAEEVVLALKYSDAARFARLLMEKQDLSSLGAGENHAKLIEKQIGAAAAEFGKLAKEIGRNASQLQFVDFGGTRPGVVPEGRDGTSKDIIVYENAAALASLGNQHKQFILGSMVKVGDAWKLVSAPALAEENESISGGIFFTPSTDAVTSPASAQLASAPSDAEQALLGKLENLDQQVATASAARRGQLNVERIRILDELAAKAKDASHKSQWQRQMADMLSAEIQSGSLPDGLKRLQTLKQEIAKGGDKDLLAHVQFLALAANYAQSLQGADVDYVKVQQQWLKDLASFVKQFPKSQETADALLQLAMAEEFAGKADEAEKWYRQAARDFASTAAAKKAEGALRRLNSVGKTFVLKGRTVNGRSLDIAQYKGRMVVVHYWSTWCEPCKSDIARLREIYNQFRSKGLEIVGVNLDNDAKDVAAYLKKQPIPWAQVYEKGGLESSPAVEMGIMTLPQMLLIDRSGRVANRSIHVAELATELEQALNRVPANRRSASRRQ